MKMNPGLKTGREGRRLETQKQQRNPKAGATYHPRSLYRGLGVEYSNRPGRKYLHPDQHKGKQVR